MIFNKYLDILNYKEMPLFLKKYLKSPSLNRLKNICYFCGMDYASKNIYDFKENISRYDHSLSVALLTWKITENKNATIAALFHDISTPCFSHVIDYMNKDYSTQESTEEYTEKILIKDKYLLNCLKDDNLSIESIADFKRYSIVDNDRPKLCTDRLDGIILTGLFWVKNLNINDVKKIIDDLTIWYNSDSEYEIGFKNSNIAQLIYEVNEVIDDYCHSKEDNYMMELLANITRNAIGYKLISYEDLYILNEKQLILILENCNISIIKDSLEKFKNIKINEILEEDLPYIKARKVNPLVKGIRLK